MKLHIIRKLEASKFRKSKNYRYSSIDTRVIDKIVIVSICILWACVSHMLPLAASNEIFCLYLTIYVTQVWNVTLLETLATISRWSIPYYISYLYIKYLTSGDIRLDLTMIDKNRYFPKTIENEWNYTSFESLSWGHFIKKIIDLAPSIPEISMKKAISSIRL